MSDVRPMTAAEMVKWLDDWKEVTVSVDDAVVEVLRDLVDQIDDEEIEEIGQLICDCPDCLEDGPYHQAKALLKALDDRKK